MQINGIMPAKVLKQCPAHSRGYVIVIYFCVTNYPQTQRLKTTINMYHLTQGEVRNLSDASLGSLTRP